MFFNGWAGIARVVIMAVLGYVAIVALVRTSGKRTLSKMNAFDLVVTITLGSMLATIILSKDIALAEGVAGLATVISMQFIIAWLSSRLEWFRQIVKGRPALLYYNGEILHEALKRERVSPPEIYAAIRADGHAELSAVSAVVLETDGSFTVLSSSKDKPTTLEYVNMHRGSA